MFLIKAYNPIFTSTIQNKISGLKITHLFFVDVVVLVPDLKSFHLCNNINQTFYVVVLCKQFYLCNIMDSNCIQANFYLVN